MDIRALVQAWVGLLNLELIQSSWLNLSGMSTIAENPDGATIKGREKQEAEILSDCESELSFKYFWSTN